MTNWSISSGHLEATISAKGELRFGDLPWRIDLGPVSAWVAVKANEVETRRPVVLGLLTGWLQWVRPCPSGRR